MCEVCKKNEKIEINDERLTLDIFKSKGEYSLDVSFCGFKETSFVSIKINYCPICGKEL